MISPSGTPLILKRYASPVKIPRQIQKINDATLLPISTCVRYYTSIGQIKQPPHPAVLI